MRSAIAKTAVIFASALCLLATADAQTILTSGDTKIRESQPDTNFGGAGWLHVNSDSTALFEFDVSGIQGPVNAELQIEVVGGGVRMPGRIFVESPLFDWSEFSVTGDVGFAEDDWDYTVRGDSKDLSPADDGTFVTFDISDIVNVWIDDPSRNRGLGLQTAEAEIVFRSRESQGGRFPARIVITPASVRLGDRVTVAASGGDYSNLADAADNAYSGDTWCTGESDFPCVIEIEAGDHHVDRTVVLDNLTIAGQGRSLTRLIAARGIGVVIRSATEARIEDLSIMYDHDRDGWDVAGIAGNVQVYSAAIYIATPGEPIGIVGDSSYQGRPLVTEAVGSVRAYDTPIEIRGDYRANGIYATDVDVDRVDITVLGDPPEGIDARRLNMSRSSVYVDGRAGAAGVGAHSAIIRNSEIAAYANYGAVALGANNRLTLVDSTVEGGDTGLRLRTNEHCRIRFDGSEIQGGDPESIDWKHEGSQLCAIRVSASVIGPSYNSLWARSDVPDRATVHFFHSSIGGLWPDINAFSLFNVSVTLDTSVMGTRFLLEGASSISCTNTRDFDANLLDETCSP